MNYDPGQHHRRSIRWKGYDYARAGVYFVTVCTEGRACLFGDVDGERVRLNEGGRIVEDEWIKTGGMRPRIMLDQFVVMPNHIHGIIVLMDGRGTSQAPPAGRMEPQVGAGVHRASGINTGGHVQRAPTMDQRTSGAERFGKPTPDSIPTIIRLFKAATTKRIRAHRGTPGAVMWQRNYYEHVVRNGDSLDRIRRYIADNPARWAFDRENPQAACPEDENAWAQT
jgi:putative transposase